ncbi:MAG: NAD(P)-binding protein [Synechococcus sp.]
MTRCVCDLAVIGAGLAGTTLLASLRLAGWQGTAMVLEAGRGPGGRASTRQRREHPHWQLDHGAPVLQLQSRCDPAMAALLQRLEAMGAIAADTAVPVGIGLDGIEPLAEPLVDGCAALGHRWRGRPSMAAVADALLAIAGDAVLRRFGVRVQTLQRMERGWELRDQHGQVLVTARMLVLSGTLLAHPRSLALLGLADRPLRQACPVGLDPALDQALDRIALIPMAPRWNRMLELSAEPDVAASWPRTLVLSAAAAQRWQLERLVLQPMVDGRIGLVAHGLTEAVSVSADLLSPWPSLAAAVGAAKDLGVMRWGAARPLDHPLPASLQWCPTASVGFCGDWVEGPGFGCAHGAMASAVALADRILQRNNSAVQGAMA